MFSIRPMQDADEIAVLEIYQQGIDTGMSTFETEPPDWQKFNSKFLPHCRLVSTDDGTVTGWAVLSGVSTRECFKGVGEVTLYVHEKHQRQGIGRNLLLYLIGESERLGYWSLLSVIHQENIPSIHLHEQCGFRLIGYREKIANLRGRWKTVIMMERRSKVVGV